MSSGNQFDHLRALAGEPVYLGGKDITERIYFRPKWQQWELRGFDGVYIWNQDGSVFPQKFVNHPPLTTTAQEGDKTE